MFNNTYSGKRVLVTGDTGFKGSWLCNWLLELGAEVYGLALGIPTQPSMFEETHLPMRVKHLDGDIRMLDTVVDLLQQTRPDYVFHLAAQPIVKQSYDNPVETMATNVLGTTHILEALRLYDETCIAVFITSDKCYDNVEWVWGYREHDPLGGKDPYSASKGAAELMIKTYFYSYFNKPESNIRLSAVRAGNVIGGGDWAANRIVPDCIRAWSRKEIVEIRSPNATRPWQHVLEPLSGYLRVGQLLTEKPELNGEAFNFGPAADVNQTVLELLNEISLYWDFGTQTEKFRVQPSTHFHEAGLLKLNCDKALFHLAWKPTLTFEQTAEMTASWYNKFYNHPEANPQQTTLEQIRQYIQHAQNRNYAWTR